jgi:TatD DNase family protein
VFADSHCHLADEAFERDLDAVVARAREAGLSGVLCVLDAGSDEDAARAARLSALWPAVRFAVGVHPHQAGAYALRAGAAVEAVERALRAHPDACAIGEIGLDYHYDFAPADVQRDTLAAQVGLAADRGMPVVIHAREAEAEVVDIIGQVGGGRLRGVFHCYTGDVATMRRVLDLGFSVGFGGIVTFPGGQNVRDLLGYVPVDRVLIETDSPYLAPVQYRGQRNEPAWVVRVAERIGQVLGVDTAHVAERTRGNFDDLFGAANVA